MLGPRRKPIGAICASSRRTVPGDRSPQREGLFSKRRRVTGVPSHSTGSDDDVSDSQIVARAPASRRSLSARRVKGDNDGGGGIPSSPKEKRYAWMDSGDESGAGSGSEALGKTSEHEGGRRGEPKSRREDCGEVRRSQGTDAGGNLRGKVREEVREAVLGERKGPLSQRRDDRDVEKRIAEISTFSDMVRLAPALQRRAASLTPKELVAAVSAAARVRFFDYEVFQSGLLPAARRHFSRKASVFTSDELVDLVRSLGELNCYDKEIFSKVVESFTERKQELEDPLRCERLLTAFKNLGHKDDPDFLEFLNQKHNDDRYKQRLRECCPPGSDGPIIWYGGLRK